MSVSGGICGSGSHIPGSRNRFSAGQDIGGRERATTLQIRAF
jgi:hypothetical protein